jgi:pimeloyl-ACP methyl ester carboxylesterase
VLEKNSLDAGERFDGEVLFIVGGKSRYVQSADHAAITAHFTRAQVETITESGHNPHMETRGAFVRLIRTAQ